VAWCCIFINRQRHVCSAVWWSTRRFGLALHHRNGRADRPTNRPTNAGSEQSHKLVIRPTNIIVVVFSNTLTNITISLAISQSNNATGANPVNVTRCFPDCRFVSIWRRWQ
jgi:hypothetical protein